jgi:ferritin-like metal-binding protein YciE
MGLFSKDITSMDDLYLHTLQDIYYAENQIVKALPKMINLASNLELKDGLSAHLDETHMHVSRLQQVFNLLGERPAGVVCPAIDGILEEADEITGDISDATVLDAAIAAASQAVEHYEITRYGTLIAWSKELGRTEIADILDQTLNEEYAADDKLTALAEARLNRAA